MSFDAFDERLYTLQEAKTVQELAAIFQEHNLSGQIMTLEYLVNKLKINVDKARVGSGSSQIITNNIQSIKVLANKIEGILNQANLIYKNEDGY